MLPDVSFPDLGAGLRSTSDGGDLTLIRSMDFQVVISTGYSDDRGGNNDLAPYIKGAF